MAYSGVEGKTLEFTPSWVVALVCFSIVLISLAVDKFLQCVGQLLNKSEWKTLVGAFRKIKEELMLLGFISLLLAVFQTRIEKICIPERLANVWLPCKKLESSSTTALFTNFFRSSETRGRHLLADTSPSTDFCAEKGKVPLLTAEALHHLDIFIFVLGTFHVILCVIKIVLGYEKIHQWNKLANHDDNHKLQQPSAFLANLIEVVISISFGAAELLEKQKDRGCLANLGEKPKGLGWMCSFFKQFYPSVTKFEYLALRLNFMACDVNKTTEDSQSSPQARDLHRPEEEFRNYIIDVVRKDFEKIVGIRWYLWILAVIFLLVNVAGWHAYFWISFFPLTLLLIAGTILEHMITRLAEEVAQKKSEKEAVKFPSGYFWFRRHQFVLNLIHIVLFQNSLELIFFFFVLFQYDFHSCIMGKAGFAIPRIVIGAFAQFMCIYRTLPLYAIMKSQCRDETNPGKNHSGEEEDMWIVTQIWNWYEGRKSKRVAKNESAKNGSRHRSAGTTEQMKGGEVELETKADIEAPEIRERTSDTKNN